MFFCKYYEIFKNTYFVKHQRTTASEVTPTLTLSYDIFEIFKNTYFEEHLGDIQKVRSLKIPEFWPPLPKKKYLRFG